MDKQTRDYVLTILTAAKIVVKDGLIYVASTELPTGVYYEHTTTLIEFLGFLARVKCDTATGEVLFP